MDSVTNDILNEIHKLRLLKQSVFETDLNRCDITASNICLSADILLIPLYWHLSKSQKEEPLPMEEYMRESVSDFETKASSVVPRLIEKTKELDERYPSRPFRNYRAILKKCFPEFVSSEI